MTTYTAIATSEIDQDSPITQPLMTKLRDNPIAITEGSAGAPKITAMAMSNFIGTVSGTSATINLGANHHSLMMDGCLLVGGTSGLSISIEFSTNNGSTWGSAGTLVFVSVAPPGVGSFPASGAVMMHARIDLLGATSNVSGLGINVNGGFFSRITQIATHSKPSGTVDAIRLTATGGANFSFNVYGG